jgi:hypothetical protein
MQKKFIDLGGHTSYVADLHIALETLERPVTPDRVLLLSKLEMARQVVRQSVRIDTDVDLRTLVLLRQDSEALSHARLRTDAVERVRGLLVIGEAQREIGRAGERSLQEAQETAQGIEDTYRRDEALSTVASTLAQVGQFQEAWETAQAIDDGYPDWRARELHAVASALAQAGSSRRPKKRPRLLRMHPSVLRR